MLNTIIFFFALLSTTLATLQFIINMTYKKDKYYIYPWVLLAITLWSALYYLTHN